PPYLRCLPRMARLPIIVASLWIGIGCDRRGPPSDDVAAATAQRLVGVWRESGGQAREYVLDDGGAFSMKMDPGGCSDAAARETLTASGTWSVREGSLVLEAKTASDPILSGSTMRDAIRELDATTLVLDSSLAACVGQRVRLSKQ